MKMCSGVISIVGAASAANNVVSMADGGHGVTSVVRSNTGEITMTLDDPFVAIHSVQATYGGIGARSVSVKSYDPAAKTIVFNTRNTSNAAADTPNTETDYIHFAVSCKNSTVR